MRQNLVSNERTMLYTTFRRVCWVILMVGLALPVFAGNAPAEEGEAESFNPMHHVADAYYLDFTPFFKVELPRIFILRDEEGHLDVAFFPSTAAALRSGRFLPVFEGEEAEAEHVDIETLIREGHHLEAHLEPVAGEIVLDLSISRHLVFEWIAALLLITLALSMAARYRRGIGRRTAPRGFLQNALEVIILFIRDEVARPNIGKKYQKFLPYLLTVFLFILFANLLGLVPFGATSTANITVTATLATFTFLVTHLFASKDYWQHIIWPPGIPTFVKPILIPVEILGMFTKPFALAIRLFANMTAGHLVILTLIGLIFIISGLLGSGAGLGTAVISVSMALFIYLLELLVAFIQAYVFTMLSAIFIGMAVAEHH